MSGLYITEENTLRGLLIIFIVLPILEMWVLISVGSKIGALPTIGLVLLTAIIGLGLLRQQGFTTLMRARQRMDAGEVPAQEMAEGLCLAVGGALLLTPGFITDTIGFFCLIPGLRRKLVKGVLHLLGARVVYSASYQHQQGPFYDGGNPHDDHSGRVFEGETVDSEPEGSKAPKKLEK